MAHKGPTLPITLSLADENSNIKATKLYTSRE
jgi:hypothetical protein